MYDAKDTPGCTCEGGRYRRVLETVLGALQFVSRGMYALFHCVTRTNKSITDSPLPDHSHYVRADYDMEDGEIAEPQHTGESKAGIAGK